MSGATLLEVEHLTMKFGGLTAVSDLCLSARNQEITAIIGPNGAGKTTVFNCLTGFYKPTVGRLQLSVPGGEQFCLERMDDFRIARAGVARTFQNIRLFPAMSVLENLVVAQHNELMRASFWSVGGLIGSFRYRSQEKLSIELASDWLDRIGLVSSANKRAGDLPYGDQRRLEIARAMCTGPALLCLDEPAAGLNSRESAELNSLLCSIRDQQNIGILLIEHDMNVVMNISDQIVVLDHGQKISSGSPTEINRDPKVINAYLGEPEGGEQEEGGL